MVQSAGIRAALVQAISGCLFMPKSKLVRTGLGIASRQFQKLKSVINYNLSTLCVN